MSEYITGRINLSECAPGKKIKGASKGKEGDLEFVLKGKTIKVDKVPSNYGGKPSLIICCLFVLISLVSMMKLTHHFSLLPLLVRCGAIVEGYAKDGSTTVHKVTWPNKSKKCTLSEIVKFNDIDRNRDMLILENEVLYCTHWIKKIDTKNYGLPQTRERVYMFVWQPDDGNFDDDLGTYWETIVKYLASPVRHSLESFILDVDHDIIRTFREALNGPAGR